MLTDPAAEASHVAEWIASYFAPFAPRMKAVVGISGGKDSSVAAALCTMALGHDRVIGVAMPDGRQSDLADSMQLIDALGIEGLLVNVETITAAVKDAVAAAVGQPFCPEAGAPSRLAEENIPPRARMVVLYAVAQSIPEGALVVNTCNLSENFVGYSTKYGDAAGDLSPLGSFTASEVLQLGEAIGVPSSLLAKPPADGISGMTDEENLGFSYETLDGYIERGMSTDPEAERLIMDRHVRNLHKMRPMPTYPHRRAAAPDERSFL